MGTVFSLIQSISILLYSLLGVFLLWNLRSLVLAQGELRNAQFGLERELAQRQGGRALTFILLALEFLAIIWAISTIAAPTWEAGLPEAQLPPTAPFFTDTPSNIGEFNPIPSSQPGGVDIISTAPPPSTPAGTIIAPGERIGCIRNQIWIDYPANGMRVFEPITVTGVANVENFAFYRFEIKADRSGASFAPLAGDKIEPVAELGPLGDFIPSFLDGGYRFRLVVFDTLSNPVGSCEITIYISAPVPTETPIGN